MKEVNKKTRISRLKRIAQALKIAVPQFGDIVLEDDNEGIPHLYASYVHWRPNAFKQSETAFSDGTLRLIGLLWSIAEKGGPLLLEEPELSLNDAVVAELPRMFTRMQSVSARQIITTTHSTALLDDPLIGLREVHRIEVDNNGSRVTTLADDPSVTAQVDGGMTISQAALPLLRPKGIDKLGRINVAD
jgi:predicted ATPase